VTGRTLRFMPQHSRPQLELRWPGDARGDGYTRLFEAELTGEGLAASTGVLVLDGPDLDAFLDRLSAAWRGWQGELVWEALERGMTIAAVHDRIGHVRLRITLRESYRRESWEATATLVVDAGEELCRLARLVAAFMAV
jgi:hypothetical protein